MRAENQSITRIAATVALGGFLMGFDASVISGVIRFTAAEFGLSSIEIGWMVASLTLTATLAMMLAGPLSDRIGRRKVLMLAAGLYFISAVLSALAPSFISLVVARMVGGLGVGAALIIAPMYIAEIAPAARRGRLVSFNQLNIVLGISVAFFSNYLILKFSQSDASWVESLGFNQWTWRWMLGIEAIPALIYAAALFLVPESPRWLLLKGRASEALAVLTSVSNPEQAKIEGEAISQSLRGAKEEKKGRLGDLFKPSLRLVLLIGVVVAVLQQITGINAVFFYAPMIFEQSGIGTDAAFMQAVLVGIINLVFTILAMVFIDRIGRKVLLVFGVSAMTVSLAILAFGFHSARYTITEESLSHIAEQEIAQELRPLLNVTFSSDLDFQEALVTAIGEESTQNLSAELTKSAIAINPKLILFGILGFVAGFAISLGPVMWVLFSEIFPNAIRGLAISFVGLINSATSFSVQFLFPWELAVLGNALTFGLYAVFSLAGLLFIIAFIPETKGKTLEELEHQLVDRPA